MLSPICISTSLLPAYGWLSISAYGTLYGTDGGTLYGIVVNTDSNIAADIVLTLLLT